jgi:hypothetical protein
VTTQQITTAFEQELTRLNDRNVRLGGGALSLEDPRVIATQIAGFARIVQVSSVLRLSDDTDPLQRGIELGAQVLAFCLAVAREDELRVDLGEAA